MDAISQIRNSKNTHFQNILGGILSLYWVDDNGEITGNEVIERDGQQPSNKCPWPGQTTSQPQSHLAAHKNIYFNF